MTSDKTVLHFLLGLIIRAYYI